MPPSRSKRKRKDHGFDIEDLAQRKARYFIAHAEETQFLAADPTARDKAIAELYQKPDIKRGFPCADTFVGPEDDPDAFLEAVDSVLNNPVKTVEQRVLRFHAAVSGLLVFNEHKLYRPLNHRRDLENKVQSRSHQIYMDWANKNLPSSSDVGAIPAKEPLTPPPSRLPSSSMTPVTSDTAEGFLSKPLSIFNMKFIHEANTSESGAWQVESFLTKSSGEVVYNVLFEDCAESIPHDADGMRVLLRGSHVLL
ncbi:hypothetical protein K466DRAFT_596610 [Polyporus arcularius HHB13444]|uniref:Uncharacterized protein n=1 Tax=Polyporus arcularius HHB13444 TaxID=1314778 RepID=A0A5C3PST7_9APHY|nr:hypothetical protein K466DRAFT_596610 [Polyporus arcularius HHB13444]